MIENKVAIITGAAQGIGRAHAELLLDNKAKVCIGDTNTVRGRQTERELQDKYGKSNIIFTKCDVTQEAELRNLFDVAKKQFGRIDIVVNNAGIMDESRDMLLIDINLKAVIVGTKLALEYMGTPGGGKGGLVINMASTSSLQPMALVPTYAASKHAVLGYTRSIGMITPQSHGVRVNCICPSFTDTEIISKVTSKSLMGVDNAYEMYNDAKSQHTVLSPSTVAACLIPLIENESWSGRAILSCDSHPQAMLMLPRTEKAVVDMYVKSKL